MLISIDTLRADRLGTYGYERFTSPVLDEFARRGVVFEDASSPAPWTLPSHASMLTGLTPVSHGLVNAQTGLSTEVETLADWFNAAGWKTSAIINTFFLRREKHGITRGFEDYLSIQRSDYKQKGPSSWVTDEAILRIEDQGRHAAAAFRPLLRCSCRLQRPWSRTKNFWLGPIADEADGSAWQLMRANFANQNTYRGLSRGFPSRSMRIREQGDSPSDRCIDGAHYVQ